jgi:hypothetical protein
MAIIEKIDSMISEAQAKVDDLSAFKTEAVAELQYRYSTGVADGKAMIQLPDVSNPDNIYTQAQMNEAVSAGQKQQRDLDVAEFQSQIDALNSSIDSKIAEAIVSKNAEFYAELQSVSSDDAALRAKYAPSATA